MGEGLRRAFAAAKATRPAAIEPVLGETRDVVLRVPQDAWLNWLAEGDHPGEEPTETWSFFVGRAPTLAPGARCYVVAFGLVRGYAPIVEPERGARHGAFLRRGGAVAVTVPGLDLSGGRWSWRYRCWKRENERPFDGPWDWALAGLPKRLRRDAEQVMLLREHSECRPILKQRALDGMTAARDLLSGMKTTLD